MNGCSKKFLLGGALCFAAVPMLANAGTSGTSAFSNTLVNQPSTLNQKTLNKLNNNMARSRCVRWYKRCYRVRRCAGGRAGFRPGYRCFSCTRGWSRINTCSWNYARNLRYRGYWCRTYWRGGYYSGGCHRWYYTTRCYNKCAKRVYY